MLSGMTTLSETHQVDSEQSTSDLGPDVRVLRVHDGPVRTTAARLERLAGDLEAVAEPREPDVGQRHRVDGRLAVPICLPARELARLLGALSAALFAVSHDAAGADGDAAAHSLLLQRELP